MQSPFSAEFYGHIYARPRGCNSEKPVAKKLCQVLPFIELMIVVAIIAILAAIAIPWHGQQLHPPRGADGKGHRTL